MFDLSKLVDIISAHKYDAEAVCLQLAKSSPALFIELIEYVNTKNSDMPPWMKVFIDEIRYNGFIPSIKMLRESTGLGLKDAKDTVENLINYRLHILCEKSYYDAPTRDINSLTLECKKIYEMIVEGFDRYPL